jgi:hypothetical protein
VKFPSIGFKFENKDKQVIETNSKDYDMPWGDQ